MKVHDLPTLSTEYNDRLMDSEDYTEFAGFRNALTRAGAFVIGDTKAGYREGYDPSKHYTKAEHAVNMQALLDFVALSKGDLYEVRGYEDECSAFFTKPAPTVDFNDASAPVTPPTAIRPVYTFNPPVDEDDSDPDFIMDLETYAYSLSEKEQEKLMSDDDGIDFAKVIKYKYKLQPTDSVDVIFTHDGFEANWDVLEKIARSNKPTATLSTNRGSSHVLVVIQTQTPLPSFQLVQSGVPIPGLAEAIAPGEGKKPAVKLPRAGKEVTPSIQDRWNTRMLPLIKEGKGVTEYIAQYGKGISPEKLKALAQAAVNSGHTAIAEDLLREAAAIDQQYR